MKVGLDLGYNAVKLVASTNGEDVRRVTFPSVIGTANISRFGLESPDNAVVTIDNEMYMVGEQAVTMSQFLERREDRKWYTSRMYYILFLASLAQVTTATSVSVDIVTGLPMAYYGDRHDLRKYLEGEHSVKFGDRHEQHFRVNSPIRIVGQPFGTLLNQALGNNGMVIDKEYEGYIGIVDTGGHTTNLLACLGLTEITRESASVPVGGWTLVQEVSRYLKVRCPELEPRDHEVVNAIRFGKIKYFGKDIDLKGPIADLVGPLGDTIVSEATKVWNGGAGLDKILITGGGAYLIGECLKRRFEHAVVVDDPVFANALGFWKLARRQK